MSEQVACFFAYADQPRSLSETIESAISKINNRGARVVNIRGWKSLDATGTFIIHRLCAAINDSDLFICDLTKLSPNVLFELGYAIARKKRVWITLDTSYQEAEANYRKLGLLSSVLYASYHNSLDLTDRFFQEEPYCDLESTIFGDVIESIVRSQPDPPHLLYLKSEYNTEASIRLTRALRNSRVPLVVDDPEEVPAQPLDWYALKSYYACGVVCHLIDEQREPLGDSLRNARYSLVAGLAYGFEKPIILLAHSPFSSPVDYRDLLKVHETATGCTSVINAWLPAIENGYLHQRAEYSKRQSEIEATVGLQRIHLGEYVAENEHHELDGYFVRTAAFSQALSTYQYEIYVGRKGSGKTANLYQLDRELSKDKRNHITVIKPVDYELEGVVSLLTSNLSKADPGYLIESLWKFLIYTELSLDVYKQIKGKPRYLDYDATELEFIAYVEGQPEIFAEFTVRMEHVIRELCRIEAPETLHKSRVRVSEILHLKLLDDLRRLLGMVLGEKLKVFVLMDNLDKAWKRRKNLDVLSDFLFGLLSAGQTISAEFQKDRRRWPGVNLALVIFLRSDIFAHIKRTAREKDKIAYTRMSWNDPALLNSVIEERFAHSLEGPTPPGSIWQQYFAEEIRGEAPEDYIVSRVIPRPRDMIFLCRGALWYAINRKHTRIEEDDILDAEKNYSEYAFNTLLAETETQFEEVEALLYEFAGVADVVTERQIARFLEAASIAESQLEHIVDLLFESTFLGLETRPGHFEFLYEPSRKMVLQKLAERTAQTEGKKCYKINAPFHSFLEIQSSL